MERLKDAQELIDGPLDDPGALDGNLRDLRLVNRLLGGVTLSRAAIDGLLSATGGPPGDGSALEMLDVGTGAADIPLALIAAWRRRGRRLRITAIEHRQELLDAARRVTPNVTAEPDLVLAVADGRGLPYPDGAFDVVHASLLLHHLEPADAVAFLREAARVARRGVVVNDLDRTRAALLAARVLTRLATRNRYTRVDALLSVRRAYRFGEARALLREAGLRPVHQRRHPLFERWAIAAVRG
jgi:SAM-dependent methyltransferase